MRNTILVVALLILFVSTAFMHGGDTSALPKRLTPKPFTYDPQYAAGEWKIEVHTPPCDKLRNGAPNMQVIFPKESGAPITIECDAMPVGTR